MGVDWPLIIAALLSAVVSVSAIRALRSGFVSLDDRFVYRDVDPIRFWLRTIRKTAIVPIAFAATYPMLASRIWGQTIAKPPTSFIVFVCLSALILAWSLCAEFIHSGATNDIDWEVTVEDDPMTFWFSFFLIGLVGLGFGAVAVLLVVKELQ